MSRIPAPVILLLLLPTSTFQNGCFPDNSTFTKFRCVCTVGNSILRCENEPLDEFPVAGQIYTSVRSIIITGSHFTELNRSHLEWYPGVTEIIMRMGRLSKMSNDVFKNTTQLETLNLLDNRLTIMPPVKNLTSLAFLTVTDNYISDIKPGDLDGCTSLIILEAENNNIGHLKSGALRDQTNLHILHLSGNRGLSRIDDDVFLNTTIQQLSLAYTAISRLPSTGLRNSLQELDLYETRNLKRFNTYEPETEFYNRTYPFLSSVRFFYHAHCCQMQNYRSLAIQEERVHSDTNNSFMVSNKGEALLMPMEEVEATDQETFVCVNTTSMSVVQNISEIIDSIKVSVDVFCSSEFCLPKVCGSRCAEAGDSSLGGGGANDAGSGGGGIVSDIQCIEKVSLSCLDMFLERENFTTERTKNSCRIIDGSTEEITTDPPPPPCTDKELWCGHFYPDMVSDCDVCWDSCEYYCINHEFPRIKCHCTSANKRSARETKGYQESQSHLLQTRSTMPDNNNSTNETVCMLQVDEVICRRRLNQSTATSSFSSLLLPTPTPTPSVADSACDETVGDLDDIGESLLPEGWFYLDPQSKDTVCMLIPETTTSTPSSPTTPSTTSTFVEGDLVNCEPVPNDFNPCSDLLGDSDILRAAIWFVIVFAILGNGSVLFVFVVYLLIIRRTKVKFFPMHFLYANLAAADFLMSVYLLTLASVDARTKGHYTLDDIEWRTGPGCGFAGFCAITSTVVSVYTLIVITSERLYTISFVFQQKKFTKEFALVVMIIGWCIGITMGALPLGGTVNSYEFVAVCLPFDTTNTSALVYIAFLLLATGLAFIYIAICYSIIFYQIVLSPKQRNIVRGSRQKQWKADLRMSIRMFVLVLTNFLCWFPIALVSLTAAFGTPLHGINVETAKVFVVFVFPLNACLNPFLYSLSTRAFKRHSKEILSRCGLCKDASYLLSQSNAFGLPSTTSNRTIDTTASSRRSSVISHLISLNFTMFRNHRGDDNSNHSSTTNLRRPSEASINSNEDRFLRLHTLLNTRRNSGMSMSSNEDDPTLFMQLGQTQTLDPLSSNSTNAPNKHRNTLNSASSLGVLHEVDEVADIPNGNGLIQHNPGYRDQNEVECEEGSNTSLSIERYSNEHTELSVTEDESTVVINTVQTDGESNKCSDTLSTTDDIQTGSVL